MGKVRALGSDQHKETVKKPYWIRRPSPPIQRPLFGSPSGSWLRFTITSRTRTTVYPLAAASAQACLHLHAALPWRDFFLFVINRVLQTCKGFSSAKRSRKRTVVIRGRIAERAQVAPDRNAADYVVQL
jgi:hypothetical protein